MVPVILIGLVLLGSPTPPAIEAWFAHDAPRVARDVLVGGAVSLDKDLPSGVFAAGVPAQLHSWDPGFLAGSSGPVVQAHDEWVAALYRDGQVVGTIAAALSPESTAAFSYVDDDVEAGKALESLAPGSSVVQDSRSGGLIEVRADGTALGLSKRAAATIGRPQTIADLRTAVLTAFERGIPAENDAPAEERGGAPIGFMLAVAGAVLVLWFAWRRTPAR